MDRRLQDVRVLLTRPRERSVELVFLLEDEGAIVEVLPVLELAPPSDPRPLAAAAEAIHRYAWVVFASPSAVSALAEAARQAGTLDRLERCKLAAVGPKTAAAVRELGLEVTREAAQGAQSGIGVFEAIRDLLVPGDELLLPAAEEGRRELQDALEEEGFSCTRVPAYRSEPAALDDASLKPLREVPPQVVVFGSPRTASAFLERAGVLGADLLRRAKVVAIGPTTAQALIELGFEPSAVAEAPTAEGLLEAVVAASTHPP